jgi:nucleoside-triphosphatase
MSEKTVRALLLTGVPGIGKTTILNQVAAGMSDRKVRGFVTHEIREAGRRVGFAIRTIDGQSKTLAHVKLRSCHRVGRYGVDTEALDEIVRKTLVIDNETDLYLVDEIGKMECFSERFREAITALLDDGQRLVATIARQGGGFIAEMKRRKDVEIWEATRANRDEMSAQIQSWLSRS